MPDLDAAVIRKVVIHIPLWTGAGTVFAFKEIVHWQPTQVIHLLPIAAQPDYRYLFATRRGFSTMISSRGCPFRCTFCDKSVGGSRWRARSAEDVVDEMVEVAQRYNIGFINFYDDNFTIRRERVMQISEEILRRNLDIEWKCEGRVDSVDIEMLRLMRKAGCRVVSGASRRPETCIARKHHGGAAENALRSQGKQAGLAYMILGAPGEDENAVHSIDSIEARGQPFSSLSAVLFAEHPAIRSEPAGCRPSRPTITDMDPVVLGKLGILFAAKTDGTTPTGCHRQHSIDEAAHGQSIGSVEQRGLNYQVSSSRRFRTSSARENSGSISRSVSKCQTAFLLSRPPSAYTVPKP